MYSTYTKDQVKQFVSQFGDIIVKGITDQELFFATVVAQLTVESKWATSGLSSDYNNYGGIKSTGSVYSNGSVSLDTTEVMSGKVIGVKDSFATYSDFPSFMADYVRVLHLPQYIGAGVFLAEDPYQQILAIGKGGYSTRDPKQYLSFAKGRIEACLDLYPWGKVKTTAVARAETPKSPMDTVSSVLSTAMSGILGKR